MTEALCANNLSRLLSDSGTARNQCDLLSRKSNALTITPLGHISVLTSVLTAVCSQYYSVTQ